MKGDTAALGRQYNGTVQCAGGGLTLVQMQGQLSAANVQVPAAACGADGTDAAAVCGAPDICIGIS